MLKFKSALPFRSHFMRSVSCKCRWNLCVPLLFFVQDRAYASTLHRRSNNFLLVDYLTNSLKFPKSKAVALSSRVPSISSFEKPEAVVCFFKSVGLSDAHIKSSIQVQPLLLFLDVEKNLKPKVAFYQELGLSGPQLGMIISKNPCTLTSSLDKKLKPTVQVIKEALELDGSEDSKYCTSDLMFRVLSRYWFFGDDSTFRSNIAYLRSCGVVGSQLITLLKTEPRLLSLPEAQVKHLISRATEMGFVMGSRMLAYGIVALYCNSAETINRKFELLQSFGLSRDECNEVFVKSPTLLKTSEAKLRRGVEFILHAFAPDKSKLIDSLFLLKFSMEKRVIPRYKIFETIKSRSLLKKEPNFTTMLILSNNKFMQKYILRFADDAKLLQVAQENQLLEPPED